ncbi:MAG: Gfo/Idh/MocA family protein [Bryobacteraceae bacterium]
MTRRDALRGTAAGSALLLGNSHLWAGANDRLRVAVIGMGGRGGHLMTLSAKMPNIEVAAVCDPDESRMRQWAASLEALTNRRPQTEPDLRRLMEDRDIDALLIACCNHWHAPAAIWGCQAGKHVYVEKPVAHNMFESKTLVEAATKYKRVVQTGTQNRSNARIRKGIKLLHEGLIGDVYMARWLITGSRASIGFQQPEHPPKTLHWDLWLGPAPEQSFHRNLVHYNWHWFWDFGNGEMGNNGTHYLDVARWGLNRGFPTRIQASGGRFGYKDQAQTPNTHTAVFQYDDGSILQGEIRGVYTGEQPGWWFYGSQGSVQMLPGGEFRVFWLTNKSPDSVRSWSKEMDAGVDPGTTGDRGHLANFYSAIRSNETRSLRAPIEEGHLSCGMCLLANIAYRVGKELRFDPKTENFIGDTEADQLLRREYRKPFVVADKV